MPSPATLSTHHSKIALTKPMRIQIAEHGVRRGKTVYTATRWHVYPAPAERDMRDGSEFATYKLEIKYNAVEHNIQWFAHQHGRCFEFITDEAFEQRVQDILEHEDMTEDEAHDWLDKRNVLPVSTGRALGFRMDCFPRMETAWRALL